MKQLDDPSEGRRAGIRERTAGGGGGGGGREEEQLFGRPIDKIVFL